MLQQLNSNFMGGEESLLLANNYQNSIFQIDKNTQQFQQLNKRFTITPTETYHQNPSLLMLHQKLSHKKFILRTLTTNKHQQLKQIQNSILEKLASSDNTTSYINCVTKISQYITKNQKNYCNQIYKCFVLFELGDCIKLSDYLLKSMKDGVANLEYQYQILYDGLVNMLEAIRWLRYFKHPHQNINFDQIYVRNDDCKFILNDPWLGIIASQKQQNNAYNFYSPQKIKKLRNQLQNYDPYISDIFSIGLIGLKTVKILETNSIYGQIFNLSRFYNRNLRRIDVEGIHKLLQTVSNDRLRTLLVSMLGSIQQRSQLLVTSRLNNKQTRNIDNSNKPIKLGGKRGNKISQVRESFGRQAKQKLMKNENNNSNIVKNNKNTISFTYTPYSNKSNNSNNSNNNTILHNNTVVPSTNNNNLIINYNIPTISSFNTNYHQNINTNIYQQKPFVKNKQTQSTLTLQLQGNSTKKIQYNGSIAKKPYLQPILSLQNQSQLHSHHNGIQYNHQIYNNQNKQYYPQYNNSLNNNYHVYKSQPNLLANNNTTPILPSTTPNTTKILYKLKQIQPIKYNSNNSNNNFIPSHHSNQTQSIIFVNNKHQNQQQPQKSIQKQTQKQMILLRNLNKNRSQGSMIRSMRSYESGCSEYRSQEQFQGDNQIQRRLFDELKLLQSKVGQLINNNHGINKSNIKSIQLHQQQQSPIPLKKMNSQQNHNTQATNNNNNKPTIILPNDQPYQNPLTQSQKKLFARETQQKQKTDDKIIQSQILSILSHPSHHTYHSSQYDAPNCKATSYYLAESQIQQKISEHQIDRSSININLPSSNNSEQPQQIQKQSQKLPVSMVYEPVVPTSIPVSTKLLYQQTIPQQQPSEISESQRQSLTSSGIKSDIKKKSKVIGEYVEEEYQNGGRYEGYKFNKKRNGQGTFYYKDGGFYKGKWKQNMMHGYGCLYYDNQKLAYEGQWYQDQFHGKGKVYNDKPEQIQQQYFDYHNMNDSQAYWEYYTGYLNHDMKQFMGKLMLSNGQYYEGQFSGDIVDGKGKFHRKDGTIVRGLWKQGIFERQY